MKNSILFPLSVGLLLAGCNRSDSEASRVSTNGPPAADKSAAEEQAAARKGDSTQQSRTAAAATTAPTANENPKIETPSVNPDAPPIASTPTPSRNTGPTAATIRTVTAPSTSPETSELPVKPQPAKAEISARLAEWKLTADEIKGEYDKSGRIERSRPARADEPTGTMDSMVVAQVNRRLQADADTSELKLDVSAERGVVTRKGSAQSLEQIGRAVAVALDSEGVTQAISTMKLAEPR